MATLAAGSTVSVYCPLTGTMTVTPGTSGRVSINARGRDGSQSLAPRELYTAETLSVNAGDVVSLEAINVAATYTDPAESGPALQALVSEAGFLGGPRTVLFGDSMTDQYNTIINLTVSYAPTTGVLTLTEATHRLWTGAYTRFWNYTYSSVRDQRRLQVTVVDANTYTVTLPDKPSDLPSGALSGTVFFRHESRRPTESWVNLVQMRNGQPLNIVQNAAQSGDTSTGCLGRLSRDVLAYSPQLVVMQAPGVNDESTSNGSLPESTTLTALASIFDQILASGAALIVLTITPVASGEARGTLPIMERVRRKNRWIKAYAQGKRNMRVVDAYQAIVNPSDTTGLAQTALLKSTDLIHYTIPGALVIAKLVEPVIQRMFPEAPAGVTSLPSSAIDSFSGSAQTMTSGTAASNVVTMTKASHGYRAGEEIRVKGATPTGANGVFTISSVPSSSTFTYAAMVTESLTGTILVSRSRNLFPNPLLLTATGGTTANGATGTVADNLSVTNAAGNTGTMTYAASVAAASHGFGNEQLIAITAAASGDRPRFAFENSTGGSATIANDLIPGRTYRLEALLRIASNSWADTPVTELYADLVITDSVTGLDYRVSALENFAGLSGVSIAEDLSLYLRTADITIPATANPSVAQMSIYVRLSGGITNAKTLTLGLSRIAVWDVTA